MGEISKNNILRVSQLLWIAPVHDNSFDSISREGTEIIIEAKVFET